MPHQCTDCGRSFADGSTEMLSGCPDCGGNTFQYRPDGADGPSGDEAPPEPPVESTVARTVGNAATAVRDLVGSSPSPSEAPEKPVSGPDPSPTEASADVEPDRGSVAPAGTDATAPRTSQEDAAQASARSEVVAPEDLPAASGTGTTDRPTPVLDGTTETSVEDDADVPRDRPTLETLREELNDQFESIRIVEPGQYELNLMELYDREEYIIALQEDGKYTIQVPERWKDE